MTLREGSGTTPGLHVLIVGKGPPDQGGISVFIETLLKSPLATTTRMTFLNLTRGRTSEGGRLSAGNLRRTAADTVAVWRAARGQDVVHLHSALAPLVTLLRAGLLALAARSRGCRVIVHAHGGLVQLWLRGRFRRALVAGALVAAHRVVAVSSGGHEALSRALGGARVSLVPNGVDTDRFRGAQPTARRPRILYVGLLTPRKGLLELIDASVALRRRGIDHELVLVGGSPDEGPAAEAQVRAAAGDGVCLRGSIPSEQMAPVYRDADIFCLPSWWEAAPLSVLEAMASGLPVVASAVGDVPAMVEHGRSGLLVAPKDGAGLADALATLAADPGARSRMGAAARERVERLYPLTRTLREVSDLYCEPS